MKISKEEVMHIATLSRLRFDEQGLVEMGNQLSNVLGKFETLNAVDVSDVPPTAHILPQVNVLREDVPTQPMDRDKLLANAPESDGSAYVVPKVLE